MKKNEKGITLIALVITIIVLIILAAVSIAMLTGNSGIISNANIAKKSTAEKGALEKMQMVVQAAKVAGEGDLTAKNLNAEIKREFGTDPEFSGEGPWSYNGFEISKTGDVKKDGSSTDEDFAYQKNVTNPYQNQEWVIAWTYGTSWSSTIFPTDAEASSVDQAQIRAKLYAKQGHVDAGSMDLLGTDVDFDESDTVYLLVIEGNGEMGSLIDMESEQMVAWQETLLAKAMGMADDCITPYIEEVYVCDGITKIGDMAFLGAKNLKKLEIANSVETVGDMILYDCTNLEDITVGNFIGGMYIYCNDETGHNHIKNVTLLSGVSSIEETAFYGWVNLTSITIPNSVTSIGEGAFGKCKSLTSITIPSSVTSIGYKAFRECTSLTSITIPSSVTSISDSAFVACDNLTTIRILKPENSIPGAPWSAENTNIVWGEE